MCVCVGGGGVWGVVKTSFPGFSPTRERDPGKRWSRVSQEKKTQKGFLFLKVLSPQSFVNIKMRHTSGTSLLRDLLQSDQSAIVISSY